MSSRKAKRPVWSRKDARTLLDSIPKDSVSGLRDLALIAAMFYSFARVSAVLKLKVDDYYHNGARRRLRLHEKGGKEHDMPVHHLLEQILNEYEGQRQRAPGSLDGFDHFPATTY
jgi:site-specific recombinase XerD